MLCDGALCVPCVCVRSSACFLLCGKRSVTSFQLVQSKYAAVGIAVQASSSDEQPVFFSPANELCCGSFSAQQSWSTVHHRVACGEMLCDAARRVPCACVCNSACFLICVAKDRSPAFSLHRVSARHKILPYTLTK